MAAAWGAAPRSAQAAAMKHELAMPLPTTTSTTAAALFDEGTGFPKPWLYSGGEWGAQQYDIIHRHYIERREQDEAKQGSTYL
jgi:hypothetical protein